MLYNAKEKKLRLSDTEIDYISFGRGEKALIMIQGLNTRSIKGAAFPLAYAYRIFAKDYTVYLFDRRPDVYDGITVRDFARDIAEAMDKLGIKSADVIGVSQGEMIAQYLAIDRPELVRRLVLAVTLSKNTDTVQQVIERWIALTQKGEMRELVTDMAERMYSPAYLRRYKPLLPLLTLLQKPKDTERFTILARSALTCNAYDELEGISCPTLVIGGKEDKVIGAGASEALADKLGCELYLYEDLGHAAYEEAKDFNSRMLAFLQKH